MKPYSKAMSCFLFVFHLSFNYQNSNSSFDFTRVFSGVRVTRSLVLSVCFEDRCLSFCPFFFGIVLSVLRFTNSDYHNKLPFAYSKTFTVLDLVNVSGELEHIKVVIRIRKSKNRQHNAKKKRTKGQTSIFKRNSVA
jgi:hypothetical protein